MLQCLTVRKTVLQLEFCAGICTLHIFFWIFQYHLNQLLLVSHSSFCACVGALVGISEIMEKSWFWILTPFAVRATTEGEGDSAGSSQEKPYGLGGPGTFFGFGRLQELQVGRLAMVGFAVSLSLNLHNWPVYNHLRLSLILQIFFPDISISDEEVWLIWWILLYQ